MTTLVYHDQFKSQPFYLGGSEATSLVPSPTPLAAMMQTLHPDTPDVTLATTLTTLGRLSADAVNCFYLQQAGVVRAMCTLLQHRKLAEPMTYDACRVLAGQARNCNMLEMARCNAAATMTMLMHCEEDDDECAASDVDGDECCGVSSRIATVIAGALADMAYEQLGKRLVVQAGAIRPLLHMASSAPSIPCRTAALLALRRLASDQPCAQVMLKDGARDQVVDIVKSSASRECKECALSLLNSLEKQSGLLSTA